MKPLVILQSCQYIRHLLDKAGGSMDLAEVIRQTKLGHQRYGFSILWSRGRSFSGADVEFILDWMHGYGLVCCPWNETRLKPSIRREFGDPPDYRYPEYHSARLSEWPHIMIYSNPRPGCSCRSRRPEEIEGLVINFKSWGDPVC